MPTAKKKIERIDAVRKQAAVHDEKPEGIDRRQTVPRCRGYDQFAMARRKRSGTMIRPLFDWPATASKPRRFPNRSERAPRSLLHQAQRLQEMPSVGAVSGFRLIVFLLRFVKKPQHGKNGARKYDVKIDSSLLYPRAGLTRKMKAEIFGAPHVRGERCGNNARSGRGELRSKGGRLTDQRGLGGHHDSGLVGSFGRRILGPLPRRNDR